MEAKFLLLLILFNFLLNPSHSLKCAEETIDHCNNVTLEKIQTVVQSVKTNIFNFLTICYVYHVMIQLLAKLDAKEIATEQIILIQETFFVKKVDAKKDIII